MTVSVKMMKVMRWPLRSGSYRKFRVGLTLHGLDKLPVQLVGDESARFLADVKWRGPKRSLGPRFRSVKRERSAEVGVTIDGGLELEQEFECECTLAMSKEGFYPWDVAVVIRKVSRIGSKAKLSVLGSGNVNLGEVAPLTGNVRQRTKVPILVDETEATLSITLDFEALGPEVVEASSIPCISLVAWERDDLQGNGVTGVAGLKPLTSILTGLSRKSRVDDGRGTTSDESSQDSPDRFESDSVEHEDSDLVDEEGEVPSFRYGSIAGANLWSSDRFGSNEDALVFAVPRLVEETSSSDSDQTSSQSSVRRILSWRKRKMSFRSPRARGEPLLNKAYGDNGGDEIDWDRRQSESPEDTLDNMRSNNERKTDAWDFGETFQVGSWEAKELTSRDGHLKLSTNVFFASIDQRSESAAGESACTALVVVLADWLHRHSSYMPSRAEFDSLIREGSAEWRKLCKDANLKDRFPDGHFDLETILEASVRPLSVKPGKSFVGFFQPDGLGDSNDFLEGAMSFDSIWDEVERSGPAIYIVSWNDHFFVLKVEEECVYIIDTLGERLYEGCDQAYLLKFDSQTVLATVPIKETEKAKEQKEEAQPTKEPKTQQSKEQKDQPQAKDQPANEPPAKEVKEESVDGQGEKEQCSEEAEVKKQGRSACREFVKGFFAAVPLRQLQSDLKKGLVGKDYLHRRLQIEFHFTESQHTTGKGVCNGCL